MNKLTKQIVYISVNGETELEVVEYDTGVPIEGVKAVEAYVFTSKELKQLLKDYTNKIVKNVNLTMKKKSQYAKNARWKNVSLEEQEEGVDIFSYQCQTLVDKKSITNQLDEFLKQI
jgi:hypothetical protein